MRMKHLFFILTFICCFAAVSKAEPQTPVTLEAARDGLTVRFPVRSVEPLIRESLLQKRNSRKIKYSCISNRITRDFTVPSSRSPI